MIGTVAAAFAAGGDSTRPGTNDVVAAFYPLAYAAWRDVLDPCLPNLILRVLGE